MHTAWTQHAVDGPVAIFRHRTPPLQLPSPPPSTPQSPRTSQPLPSAAHQQQQQHSVSTPASGSESWMGAAGLDCDVVFVHRTQHTQQPQIQPARDANDTKNNILSTDSSSWLRRDGRDTASKQAHVIFNRVAGNARNIQQGNIRPGAGNGLSIFGQTTSQAGRLSTSDKQDMDDTAARLPLYVSRKSDSIANSKKSEDEQPELLPLRRGIAGGERREELTLNEKPLATWRGPKSDFELRRQTRSDERPTAADFAESRSQLTDGTSTSLAWTQGLLLDPGLWMGNKLSTDYVVDSVSRQTLQPV